MKKVLILILIIQSCDPRPYTGHGFWDYSNKRGLTGSDSIYQYYVPAELFNRNIFGEVKIDSFSIDYISETLAQFDEQSYSQHYLGGERYRFIWLRSFNPPAIISIHHGDGVTNLVSKIGNKILPENSYEDVSMLSPKEYQFYMDYLRGHETDSARFSQIASKVIHHTDTAAFKYEETARTLSEKEWEELKKGLVNYDLTGHSSVRPFEGILDGAYWILEANLEHGYKIIFRHSPNDSRSSGFRNMCDMFIDMSVLRNDRRY